MQRVIPDTNQESVWDYPRPPRVEASTEKVQVVYRGQVIAETQQAFRYLETSLPPTYYIPRQDIKMEYLKQIEHHTFCKYMGRADYWTIQLDNAEPSENAAWSYPAPSGDYEQLKDYIAFYPGRVDACYVNGEQVTPQQSQYYGGWITSKVVGPFAGDPGLGAETNL